MNHHINNKYVATGISSYNDSFWKAMRGSDKAYGDLIDGKHSLTNTYLLPESTATKYSAALKEYDLFRRIGTVMTATKSDSTIWLSDTDDLPAWVSEHGIIPTTVESFPKKDVAAHKLAIITAIETDFISDLPSSVSLSTSPSICLRMASPSPSVISPTTPSLTVCRSLYAPSLRSSHLSRRSAMSVSSIWMDSCSVRRP